jgi:hypothetical protein
MGPSIYELKLFVLTLREKAGGIWEKFVEFLLLHSFQALKRSDSRNTTIIPALEIALKQAKSIIKQKRSTPKNATLVAVISIGNDSAFCWDLNLPKKYSIGQIGN